MFPSPATWLVIRHGCCKGCWEIMVLEELCRVKTWKEMLGHVSPSASEQSCSVLVRAGDDFAVRHLASALNTQGILHRNVSVLSGLHWGSLCLLFVILAHGILPRFSVTLVWWVSTGSGLKYVGSSWVTGICLCRGGCAGGPDVQPVGTAAPVRKQGCLHGCLPPIRSRRVPHSGTRSADAVL